MLCLLYFRYRLDQCSGHGVEKIRPALGSGTPLFVSYCAELTGSCYGREVYNVHISVCIALSVLVGRSHLDMEVSAEKKHDRRVGVPADCAIKLSFSAFVLIASSKPFAWFLSSKREKEERTRLNAKVSCPL